MEVAVQISELVVSSDGDVGRGLVFDLRGLEFGQQSKAVCFCNIVYMIVLSAGIYRRVLDDTISALRSGFPSALPVRNLSFAGQTPRGYLRRSCASEHLCVSWQLLRIRGFCEKETSLVKRQTVWDSSNAALRRSGHFDRLRECQLDNQLHVCAQPRFSLARQLCESHQTFDGHFCF
jgi:hypothetical protein